MAAIALDQTWNDRLHEHPAPTDSLERLPKPTFLRAWCAIAYLYSALHPDGYESAGSGWPRVLRRFAAQACHRAEAGEIRDDGFYCRDAQWSGLYDRMTSHTPEEAERRLELAAAFGQCPDA